MGTFAQPGRMHSIGEILVDRCVPARPYARADKPVEVRICMLPSEPELAEERVVAVSSHSQPSWQPSGGRMQLLGTGSEIYQNNCS